MTVSATSPALQVPQVTAVTDARGEYRLTPLPIGTYAVTYELSGFVSNRREEIRLTVGFTARVDVVLGVGAVQETVTVSGSAPLVDVASTTTTTQLTRETLELLPTSRNSYNAMMIQTPSARTSVRLDVGGSGFNDSPRFHTMGQLGESWQGVEDIIMQSPASNPSGSYVDYASLEEATIQVMGHSAATPTRGLAINGVVKSGGNDFHGQVYYSRTSDNLRSDNITPELEQQGITGGDRLMFRDDWSAELGGRLKRDTLWFFVSSRQRRQHDDLIGCFLPVDEANPDGPLSDTPCIGVERTRFVTGKVTYQINHSNKIVGFAQPNWRYGERGGSARGAVGNADVSNTRQRRRLEGRVPERAQQLGRDVGAVRKLLRPLRRLRSRPDHQGRRQGSHDPASVGRVRFDRVAQQPGSLAEPGQRELVQGRRTRRQARIERGLRPALGARRAQPAPTRSDRQLHAGIQPRRGRSHHPAELARLPEDADAVHAPVRAGQLDGRPAADTEPGRPIRSRDGRDPGAVP